MLSLKNHHFSYSITCLLSTTIIFNQLTACTPKEDAIPATADVVYFSFDTTQIFTPATAYVMHPSFCGYVPVPEDSSVQFYIDLNLDSQPDYEITMANWIDYVSASNPCANYSSGITIQGLDSNFKVATTGNFPIAKNFYPEERIDEIENWQYLAYLKLQVPAPPFTTNLQVDVILGLKSIRNNNYFYGWIKLRISANGIILVKEAFNKTPSLAVQAGI
jgi:hypothetical protein